MTLVGTTLTVWSDERGIPERLVWEGRRYRVTDTSTPLDFDLERLTHLSGIPAGWRFQGTDEEGGSLMFDVVLQTDEWHVLRTYT